MVAAYPRPPQPTSGIVVTGPGGTSKDASPRLPSSEASGPSVVAQTGAEQPPTAPASAATTIAPARSPKVSSYGEMIWQSPVTQTVPALSTHSRSCAREPPSEEETGPTSVKVTTAPAAIVTPFAVVTTSE